jgi:sulfonate transport system ATP-binding protein
MTLLERNQDSGERASRAKSAVTIHARGLSKAFGGRRVITNLDLHVPAGQFLAIVGRSGCGKSTLLRILAGLETPDSGTLRLDSAAGASVRLMFQEPRLLPWASVAENVAVGLGPERDKATAVDKSIAALREVGLEDRAALWPSTLSGGQKQRVALARALVSRPGFLAFDEPLGALDALTRIEMQQLVARVSEREGFTAVLVTHDVSEAVTLADRVVVLENGAITLDIGVDTPRSSRRGAPEVAAIEGRILDRLLGRSAT